MQEIGGITAIERLMQVGREGVTTLTQRTAAILVRMATDDLIEPLAVGSCDILHVTDILQATFDLKRRCTSLNQFFQMVALVHILQ